MNQTRVGVVGAGYVGLTTAVCVAERGLDTVCVDLDAAKVDMLRHGVAAIDEPGMCELLQQGLAAGTLRFSTDYADLADRQAVFVCVPTPSSADGEADLSAVESVVDNLGDTLYPSAVVALKSTVPVGTTRRMGRRLDRRCIPVVASPEFLRESHAVYDFRNPDRVVIGATDPDAAELIEEVCGAEHSRVLRMSPESAELAKYASNAFLAVKASYANSMARLSSRVGAEIGDVVRAVGADVRIGPHFLTPGPGWGGSCLPKDTAALLCTGRQAGVELAEVRAARETNDAQGEHIVETLHRLLGPLTGTTIGVLGLTFKAHTSDTRDSPALRVCALMSRAGAQINGYDPRINRIDTGDLNRAGVVGVDDAMLAVKEAQAVLVLTEWSQFRELDWRLIGDQSPGAVVLDTRNILDRNVIRNAGLRYLGNGSPGGY